MRTPEQWLSWAKYATGRPEEPAKEAEKEAAPAPVAGLGSIGFGLDLPSPAGQICMKSLGIGAQAQPQPSAARSYVDTQELLSMHLQMHREHGSNPHKHVVAAERMIHQELQNRRLPNRHRDELARAARTISEKLPPVDSYEVSAYLQPQLHLETEAVSLVSDAEKEERGESTHLYLHVSKSLGALGKALQTKINRSLPPSVNLPMLPEKAGARAGKLARIRGLYDLQLAQSWGPTRLNTWGSLYQLPTVNDEEGIHNKSAEVEHEFSIDDSFTVIVKANQLDEADPEGLHEERIVKGVILEPGMIDKTQVTLKDGTKTAGDTYDEDTVRAAAYWYMENAKAAAWLHSKQGGTFLTNTQVCLLENTVLDAPTKIGPRLVKKGAWVQAWRIYSDLLWADIKSGKIKAFSIGAFSRTAIEPFRSGGDVVE